MARQLEHVVGVAGFRRLGREMPGKIVRWKEMLAVAVAADDIGAMLRDAIPEETRDVFGALVPRQFILSRRADHLGNLRIGVKSVQAVLASGQRIEKGLLVECLGG